MIKRNNTNRIKPWDKFMLPGRVAFPARDVTPFMLFCLQTR